ncbi:MAG: hypothetical protein SynsKO_10370 [Synoicihabitans sp.]
MLRGQRTGLSETGYNFGAGFSEAGFDALGEDALPFVGLAIEAYGVMSLKRSAQSAPADGVNVFRRDPFAASENHASRDCTILKSNRTSFSEAGYSFGAGFGEAGFGALGEDALPC